MVIIIVIGIMGNRYCSESKTFRDRTIELTTHLVLQHKFEDSQINIIMGKPTRYMTQEATY